MANSEHLQILKQGVAAWNAWRIENNNITPDLTYTVLHDAHLAGADLRKAFLHDANLSDADLRGATLTGANLFSANLTGANLSDADLRGATLAGANLARADVSEAILGATVFGNINLSTVRGLETCRHEGPSILDHSALAQSGQLPLAFLRGCGLPDTLIDYLPSLLNQPFQFYSCFITR
jgi:uncharacterized protein YjbI with pentapeptide repeats